MAAHQSETVAGRSVDSTPRFVRDVSGWTLLIAFCAGCIGGCFGVIPPWPIVLLLLTGLAMAVTLAVAERAALATAAAMSAVCLSAWLLRPTVEIRPAHPGDRIHDRYFGIDHPEDASEFSVRNIAVASGTFTRRTWLSAGLFHVESGEIVEINSFTVGRTSNRHPAPHWCDMQITLALGDQDVADGRITQLGSAGFSRGSGQHSEIVNDVVADATALIPGRLTTGSNRVLYVEGDAGFIVDETMDLEAFAERNDGNYLVVAVQFH